MQKAWAKRSGFTIVEVLVVIVVVGILTGVTAAVYTGIQTRSRIAKMETDIEAVQKLVESYKARTGSYPVTAAVLNPDWATQTAWTDNNCTVGAKRADWVPDLGTTLPQSQQTTLGVAGMPGCYTYTSDGTIYVLSAWNMLPEPQTDKLYRRVGFREMNPSPASQLFYLCNYANINGTVSGSYNIANDYYKRSYTVSNITSSACNETPQSGA